MASPLLVNAFNVITYVTALESRLFSWLGQARTQDRIRNVWSTDTYAHIAYFLGTLLYSNSNGCFDFVFVRDYSPFVRVYNGQFCVKIYAVGFSPCWGL